MSQEILPNGHGEDDLGESPATDARPLAEVLAAIAGDQFRATDVARLSDLSRDDAKTVAAVWRTLPDERRAALIREMTDLAEARVELTFGRVLRAALGDPSPMVRQLAIAALWEETSPSFAAELVSLLAADPSPDVQAAAAQALGPFAEQAAAGDLDEELSDEIRDRLLQAAADPAISPVIRRRALEAVGAFGQDDEVREAIEAGYGSDDQSLQASALHAMGRSQDDYWLDLLLGELAGAEPELRYEAARACGMIGSEEAVPDLSTLGDDEDTEVRQAAIGALGQIGGRAATRVLERLAELAAEHESEADAELIAEALAEAREADDLSARGQ